MTSLGEVRPQTIGILKMQHSNRETYNSQNRQTIIRRAYRGEGKIVKEESTTECTEDTKERRSTMFTVITRYAARQESSLLCGAVDKTVTKKLYRGHEVYRREDHRKYSFQQREPNETY